MPRWGARAIERTVLSWTWTQAWTRISCLLACLAAIALAFAITRPAVNTGDYGRVTRSFDLEFAVGEAPGECPAFKPELSYPPASPVSVAGMATGGAARLLGGRCFPTGMWFALLSAIYWAGVAASAAALSGWRLAAWCAGSIATYLLFADLLNSFYEEAMFVALIPWLARLRFGGRWTTAVSLAIAFLALAAKAQAIFFVPIVVLLFGARSRQARWRHWALLGAVILAATGLNAIKARHYSNQNGYNRIYAGLGWTALQVTQWPASEFFGRREYFYATLANGRLSRAPQCAIDGLRLLGTSYWPTAAAIVAGEIPASARTQAKVQNRGIGDFVRCARELGHPLATVGKLFTLTAQSDYNLAYLRSAPPPSALAWFAQSRSALLRWAAPLFLVVAVGVALWTRSRFFGWSAGYLAILSPVFVFLGDGFYEFEKHMMLNFMMLAGCALVALRQRWEAR